MSAKVTKVGEWSNNNNNNYYYKLWFKFNRRREKLPWAWKRSDRKLVKIGELMIRAATQTQKQSFHLAAGCVSRLYSWRRLADWHSCKSQLATRQSWRVPRSLHFHPRGCVSLRHPRTEWLHRCLCFHQAACRMSKTTMKMKMMKTICPQPWTAILHMPMHN